MNKKIKLGELCKPARGQIKESPNTIIDYIDISSVDSNSKTITRYQTMPFSEAPSRARKPVEMHNVIVSTVRPNLNAVAVFERETLNIPVVSTGFCVLDCKENVDYRFIFNYCRSHAFIDSMTSQATGASYPAVTDKIIRSALVPDYSYEEQRKISYILDSVANIIELRKKEITALDELIKARFVELFGDIIINERDWCCRSWSEVLTIVNGRNQRDVEDDNGEYLICGSGGPMGRAIDYLTNENSVIIGRKGNINKPILMREKYWNVDTAFGLEPDTESINVEYLYLYCDLFNFELLNKAVTIPSLTKADLLKIEMPVPDMDIQKQFADFVAQVDKSKAVVHKALDETQVLFDSLMQEYFG